MDNPVRQRPFATPLAMILEAVLNTLKQHAAFAAGDLVIVAVSGGGDSVALLHLLMRLRQNLGISLHVASLNHGIRGDAGRQDLEFVAGLAARWRLPFIGKSADVPRLSSEWGVGIEEAARRARYAFLAQVAREQGGACIAVGHHALDQAETIVLNIARGSGLRGLRGMSVVSHVADHREIRLVRPLLRVSKQQLQSYCRQHKLAFRVDETNADIRYSRNFARHEILSRMAQLNPQLLNALKRLSESAAVDEDFMSVYFETAVAPRLRRSPGRWSIGRDDFACLHPAMKRRFLQKAYRSLSAAGATLSHAQTVDLINWSQDAKVGNRRDISATVRMRLRYTGFCVERKEADDEYEQYRLIPAAAHISLAPGVAYLIHGLKIWLSPGRGAAADEVSIRLPAKLELRLRTRRPGDRFKPKGMGGHSRKIKHWMIDRKIPREIRDRIPLICADGEIIAICLGDDWHLAHRARFAPCDSDWETLILS